MLLLCCSTYSLGVFKKLMELSKVPNLQLSIKRTNTCEKDINALKKETHKQVQIFRGHRVIQVKCIHVC